MPRSVRPSPLAGRDILSLDIPEQQVLISLVPPDRAWLGHGFESHVLWVLINGVKWVTSDADWFVSLFDVGDEGVVVAPVARRATFPGARRPFLVWDEPTLEKLEEVRASAYRLAAAYGGQSVLASMSAEAEIRVMRIQQQLQQQLQQQQQQRLAEYEADQLDKMGESKEK